jgi:3'-phosphoadenosine 5'-phosphosulfate sulfotransferase (PAPS reductase)/FAD synthetase
MKKAGYNFFAMYNNTTLGDPKADEFTRSIVKKFDVEYIETTADNPVKMWQEKGYFPILSKQWFMRYKKENPSLRINPVQCCYQLKEKYSNKVLTARKVKNVFWGNRADESQRRKFSFVDNGFYFKPKKYKWHQCYPIQHWTRKDVIDYLNIHIPDYPVTANFESGCLCCGTDIQKQFNTLKKLHDADYQKWLYYMRVGFGSEILKIKGVDPKKLEQVIKNKKEILFRI